MCNCNRRRNTMPARNNIVSNDLVRVQFTGNQPVTFYGSHTGRMYRLSSSNHTSWIDRRDAAALGNLHGIRMF
jgi:hypothetical protein